MKKYNFEFKSMIIQLYKNRRKVLDLSHKYGIWEVTIYKWIKQISPIYSIDETEITLEEMKCMKQEMLSLQEENEKSLWPHSLAVEDKLPLGIASWPINRIK